MLFSIQIQDRKTSPKSLNGILKRKTNHVSPIAYFPSVSKYTSAKCVSKNKWACFYCLCLFKLKNTCNLRIEPSIPLKKLLCIRNGWNTKFMWHYLQIATRPRKCSEPKKSERGVLTTLSALKSSKYICTSPHMDGCAVYIFWVIRFKKEKLGPNDKIELKALFRK